MMPSADLVMVGLLAILILFVGSFVLIKVLGHDEQGRSNIWKERLGQYTLQILGLTFILPTILVIAVATRLNAEAVTALLGSIIGYIFGSSRPADSGARNGHAHDRTPTVPLSAEQLTDRKIKPEQDSPISPHQGQANASRGPDR